MNRFLNRNVRAERKSAASSFRTEVKQEDLAALHEFESCWVSLEEARRKMFRSFMYAWGDQWGDMIKDPDSGDMMTEGELIKKNGKVPLKNNMIAPILNNIDGQLRTARVKPVCAVRDRSEAKLGEMMSVAIEYVHDINEMEQVDADTMRNNVCAGFFGQCVEYGINAEKGNKKDVWVRDVEPSRLFFSVPNDSRMWGVTCVGELLDMPLKSVLAVFGDSIAKREWIKNIYGNDGYVTRNSKAMQGEEARNRTFYAAQSPDMCRVILGWRLESRDAHRYEDTAAGKWGYTTKTDWIDEENAKRLQQVREQGLDDEDALLIECDKGRKETERFWYYRYMTPYGHVLQEGRSPYWHGEHNYVLGVSHYQLGQILNFVEQFIDQQRAINRTATTIDFIRGASAKGLLVVDEEAFVDMSRKDIIDEFVRYNGVLFAKPKPGVNIRDAIAQINGNASVAGEFDLLNLQLRLINEISGVNSAMQGQAPSSGTAASLYAQQVQNSSLNLKGLFDTFRVFRKRRDTKIMKTIQQFYKEPKFVGLAGSDYSKEANWYDPDKVMNADIDLTIADSNNSPAYQMLANDFMKELWQAQAIDLKMMLENTSFPFATKLLEQIKAKEAEQGEIPMDMVPPGAAQQMPGWIK